MRRYSGAAAGRTPETLTCLFIIFGQQRVRRLLLPEPARPDSDRVTPDFEHVHRELARPAATLLLVWNEYVAARRSSGGVPYRYSFFIEQYCRWVVSTGASMHVVAAALAGEPINFGHMC